jgi:hypothetical protein
MLAALLAAAPPLQPPHAAPADQAVFRSRTDVVSVPVAVRRGRVQVSDLTADDFELLDNGVPQQIDAMSLERVPLDLTLMVAANKNRTSGSLYAGWVREIIKGLDNVENVRRLLTASDRLRVVRIDLEIRGEVLDPKTPIRVSGLLEPSGSGSPGWYGRVRLADGIFYALAWPVPSDRQHVIVIIAEGWDTGSALEMRMVPTLAARLDAVIHAVLRFPQGPATTSVDQLRLGTSDPAIGAAVELTGGTLLKPADFDRTVRQIVTDFRASYLLRYTPRGVALPGWHGLTVKVRRVGDYTIRARRGYEGG